MYTLSAQSLDVENAASTVVLMLLLTVAQYKPTSPLLTLGFSTVVHALVDPVTVDMVMVVAARVSNRTDANSTDPAGGVADPVVRLLTNAGSDLTDAHEVSSARVMSQARPKLPPMARFCASRLW
jgi:hypothetical protein